MTHISRPIQIALGAAVLLVAVWFIALRGHSSSTESSGSGSSAPAASSPSPSTSSPSAQSAPGGGTPASKGHVYHGSAPGVSGLSRAIQRAQGAVAQSQQNAKQLQQKSAEASGGTQAKSAQGQTQQSQAQGTQHSQSQTQQHSQAKQQSQSQSQSQAKASPAPSKPASDVPAMQAVVEGELARGKTVAVLFWNPKGAVDSTVRRELNAAKRDAHGTLAVHVARSGEVGSFGSFTRTVQVYSTPTILLIDSKGQTSSIAGLTDAFSIGQALEEVRRAK